MRQTTCGRRFWRRGGTSLLVAGVCVAFAGSALAQEADVTFAKDVASILQEKCEACHRTGQMAPISLTTYQEVRPWARAIRAKVAAGDMPPWHMDKTIGIQEFVNDISLTADELATIVRWVDAGAPRGNPADLPPAKQWPSGERWRVGDLLGREPDLLVQSEPWTQAAPRGRTSGGSRSSIRASPRIAGSRRLRCGRRSQGDASCTTATPPSPSSRSARPGRFTPTTPVG